MTIPIFKAEREAGLAKQIRANASVAYLAELSFANHDGIVTSKVSEEKLKKLIAKHTKAETVALHPLNSILVSTGWNLNEDVLDRGEVWAARFTPEDTPLNYEHTENDIIGHLIGCATIDDDFEVIEGGDDTVVDELPDKFHIFSSAVLYKNWRDEKLQERMDQIIADLTEGKWFVSMEALFTNFDYAMITKDGEHLVIARNKDTAFLTKHLRAYGGTGKYKDARIGRLVRNITFCGKGIVAKPANPESVIFASNVEPFAGKTLASLEQFSDDVATVGYKNSIRGSNKPQQESVQMSVTVEQLQAQLDTLQKQYATVVAENESFKKEGIEKLKANVAELTTAAKTKADEMTAKSAELTKANEAVEALKKEVASKSDELTKANEELTKIKSAQVKIDRVATLMSSLNVEKTEAEELFDITASMTAEQFDKYVAKTKAAYNSMKKGDDEEAKKKKEKADAEAAAASKKGTVTASDLDTVTPNKDAALATSGVDNNKVEETRLTIAKAFRQHKGQTTDKE
jgi:hypothetical protein